MENTIIDAQNYTGHDHRGGTKTVVIDNDLNTWISCAGEMKFSTLDFQDSFNTIVVDTATNTFNGYTFEWNSKEKMFIHKVVRENKSLQNRIGELSPLPSFLKELKEDAYNSSEDFTNYFVFPSLLVNIKGVW